MWRTVLTAILAYGYGHPSFDGYRPAGFDRPLQTFYGEVNGAARAGRQKLASLDGDRVTRYFRGYADQVEEQLRAADLQPTPRPGDDAQTR